MLSSLRRFTYIHIYTCMHNLINMREGDEENKSGHMIVGGQSCPQLLVLTVSAPTCFGLADKEEKPHSVSSLLICISCYWLVTLHTHVCMSCVRRCVDVYKHDRSAYMSVRVPRKEQRLPMTKEDPTDIIISKGARDGGTASAFSIIYLALSLFTQKKIYFSTTLHLHQRNQMRGKRDMYLRFLAWRKKAREGRRFFLKTRVFHPSIYSSFSRERERARDSEKTEQFLFNKRAFSSKSGIPRTARKTAARALSKKGRTRYHSCTTSTEEEA